jgi:hypothetical protein
MASLSRYEFVIILLIVFIFGAILGNIIGKAEGAKWKQNYGFCRERLTLCMENFKSVGEYSR